IRSAAKNFQDVAVVTSPTDYQPVASELRGRGGELSLTTKWRLAQQAFAVTAAYDAAIASTLESVVVASAGPASEGNGASFHRLAPEILPEVLRISYRRAA